jgi:hypothetical protein
MRSKLDLTAMYVAHDALRRDLELIARTTARVDRDRTPPWTCGVASIAD